MHNGTVYGSASEWDAGPLRELNKLAPCLRAAGNRDEDHESEDGGNAGWDLSPGSAAAATRFSSDHSPPRAMPVPQSFGEVMRSKYAHKCEKAMESEIQSLHKHEETENVGEGSVSGEDIIDTKMGVRCYAGRIIQPKTRRMRVSGQAKTQSKR